MKQKKFGARVLTREELRLTLPTYDKLLDQIEEIRGQSWNSEETSNLLNQKINNISILGARGSGKTSILKTLIWDLEKQNEENTSDDINIILPMMIPESMSDDKNLMSMILGLFERVVNEMDEMETKQHKRNQACWDVHESDIKKQYRELIKKFCLIQPEYKKVPIEQYTTENDYVKKHSEAYSAEIQFSSSLNRFINLLSEAPNRNTSNSIKNKLIFIFIDDIDLSTHRCVDVVRTLLAYLSHPRIVTVLSGDLQTFEEALTIDFVRKEHVLSGDILNIHFSDSYPGAFLKRKKELSYEYLKKVLPAPYRHHVKVWDLNSRGDFRIEMDPNDRCDDQDAAKNSRSLSELLTDCFIDMQNPPIFQCLEIDDYFQGENLNSESEGDSFGKIKYKNIPQLFHIFDSTARGLNNVYNVLLEIRDISYKRKELKNQNQQVFWDGKLFRQIKLLLETIVVSNSKLNRYYSELFADIIKFGTGFEDTDIDLDNLNHIIKRAKRDEFLLYTFVDFSIRLLRQTNLFSKKVYMELRFEMMKKLINQPRLSGSITRTVKATIKEEDSWYLDERSGRYLHPLNSTLDVICSFLFNLDFYYAVVLYNYLTEDGYDFFSKKGLYEDNQRILSLYYLILSVSKIRSKDETEIARHLISLHKRLFEYIKNLNGINKNTIIIRVLLGSFFKEKFYPDVEKKLWKIFDIYFEFDKSIVLKLLVNTISSEFVRRELFQVGLNESFMSEYKQLSKKYLNQLETIFAIDSNRLWKNSNSEKAEKFIENRIKEIFKKTKDFDEESLVNISEAKEVFKDFIKYIGYDDQEIVEKVNKSSVRDSLCISYSDYEQIITNLENYTYKDINSKGRKEAIELLKMFDQSKLIINFEDSTKEDKFYMWLYIYLCAQIGREESNYKTIVSDSAKMGEFISLIYDAYPANTVKSHEEYKEILMKSLPNQDSLKNFDDLFSEKEDIDEEDVEVSNAES